MLYSSTPRFHGERIPRVPQVQPVKYAEVDQTIASGEIRVRQNARAAFFFYRNGIRLRVYVRTARVVSPSRRVKSCRKNSE